jgi:putative AlgH/UPF0301 family transcriptional regulator
MTSSIEEGLGGPVQEETVTYIYGNDAKIAEARSVLAGIWWLQSRTDAMATLGGDMEADSGKGLCMRLHGYAGWAPRQLEMEILRGAWRVYSNATKDVVFSREPLTLWDRLNKALDKEDAVMGHVQPLSGSYFAQLFDKGCLSFFSRIAHAIKDVPCKLVSVVDQAVRSQPTR